MLYFTCGGLNYKINPKYKGIQKLISNYLCEENENAFDITITDEELLKEKESDIEYNYPNDEIEKFAALRKVVRHCLDYNRMIIHGACIDCDGSGFIFIAPSKTGKSTHISLWKKYLEDKVTIINGDKPMLRFDKIIEVCGTPWNGKEGLGCNSFAPLTAIIQIKQSKVNSIRKLEFTEALGALYCAIFEIRNSSCASKIMKYLGRIVAEIPVYELNCDISKEAFECSYNELIKKHK